MRILVLDKNIDYSQRLKYYLTKKYVQVQMTVCDSIDAAYKLLGEEVFDAVLFSADFDEVPFDRVEPLIGKAAFAYLSETNEIINELPTFMKYSRVSALYDMICKLYEEKKGRVMTARGISQNNKTEVILFLPVDGGAGSSTLAAACTQYFGTAAKTLYVNMEQNSSDGAFFDVKDNKKCMSDIATMLRTKYSDSSLIKTIRDCTNEVSKTDAGAVSCIRGYANILDSASMSVHNLEALINALRDKFDHRYVIIDADLIVGNMLSKLLCLADKAVFVTAGTDISGIHMKRITRYLDILRRGNSGDMPELYMIYNMYKGTSFDITDMHSMKVLSRVPVCRPAKTGGSVSQDIITEILSGRDVFGGLTS